MRRRKVAEKRSRDSIKRGPGKTVSNGAKDSLFFGILALVLPALSLALIWFVSLDKDYAVLVFAGAVGLSVPVSIVTSLWALRRGSSTKAWVGLIFGLLATCIYVIGGLGFFFLLASVLRQD
jgi:hypothetical protein